jgi:hypothetical protein
MSLILNHLDGERRQFHDLKPLGLRITRTRLTRKRLTAASARLGHERFDSSHSFGGKKHFEMRRMARLTATLPFRFLLDYRRFRPKRIGGWWRR